MSRASTLVAFRTLVLVALAASAALLYDYTKPIAAFCQSGGGCETVRQSPFAYVFGVPQPVIGLTAFVLLLVGSFQPHAWRARYLTAIATVGAVAALVFLGIQAFVLHAFCHLCVVVDTCAIALGVIAWLHRSAKGDSDGALPAFGWSLLAVVAASAPYLFGQMQPKPDVPAAVVALWKPGKLNIVEMSDFECPFCRLLHADMHDALEPYGDRVRVERLTVPLPMHRNARTASRAYVCARVQGKADEMADLLFKAGDLTDQGCRALAKELAAQGLDPTAFEKCFSGPESEAMVEADVRKAKAITFKGLPTLWIGSQMLIGRRSAEEIRAAIDEELQGKQSAVPRVAQGWLWAGLLALFASAAGYAVFAQRKR
jgi:uncharacterized membrane protein/protein-disulfide isomerase